MQLTLWRNALCVLTLCPGIISLAVRRIPCIRNRSEVDVYLCCVMAVVVLDMATLHRQMAAYLLVPAATLAAFLMEVACAKGPSFLRKTSRAMHAQIRKRFITLIMFPCFEEYLYRFYLYDVLIENGGTPALFVVASVALFVGSHLYSQRERALTKIPLGLLLALTYALSLNVFICLSIHLAFNLCVFFYNQSVMGRKFSN